MIFSENRAEDDRSAPGHRPHRRTDPRPTADPGRHRAPDGRRPRRAVLPLRRPDLRGLGRPPVEPAHPAGLPPGRHGLRRLPPDRLARGGDGLLQTSVADVHAWRDHLVADGAAPKTLNRRIASLAQLLQIPPGRRGRAAAADHRSQPGPRPVPRPRRRRPPRGNPSPLSNPGSAAHGASRRRYGLRRTATGRSSNSTSTPGPASPPVAASTSRTSTTIPTAPPSASTRKAARRRTIGLHFTAAEAIPNTSPRPGSRTGRSSGPARTPAAGTR